MPRYRRSRRGVICVHDLANRQDRGHLEGRRCGNMHPHCERLTRQSGGSCRLHFPKSQPLAELMALNLWGNQGPPPDGGGGAFPPFRHCTRVAISCTVLRPLLTGSLLEHTFVNRHLFEHPTWVCSGEGFLQSVLWLSLLP